MVGFTAVFIIHGVVILVRWICYTYNFNRSAVIRIIIIVFSVVTNMNPRYKRLEPAPLCHQCKTLVDIGISYCFAVIGPGYTHILIISIFVNRLGQSYVAVVYFKILRLRVPIESSKSVVAGYSMLSRKQQTS